MICLFCDSQHVKAIQNVKSPHFDFVYTLHQCHDCLSAFFNLHQHQVDLEPFYAEIAGTKAEIYEVPFRLSRYWQHETQVIRKFADSSPRSVLDVGCRTGDFLMHWPSDIIRVGVELSERSARVARSRGLEIHQDYLEKVKFDRSFDVVTCYAVIEHLENPSIFIAKLSQLVNPGGVLAVMIPSRECLKRTLIDAVGKRWHMYCPPQHLNFASRKHLDKVLGDGGFVLQQRFFKAGGMFNPLGVFPVVSKVGAKLMEICDQYSPTNRIPIFDHMYSYYSFK